MLEAPPRLPQVSLRGPSLWARVSNLDLFCRLGEAFFWGRQRGTKHVSGLGHKVRTRDAEDEREEPVRHLGGNLRLEKGKRLPEQILTHRRGGVEGMGWWRDSYTAPC